MGGQASVGLTSEVGGARGDDDAGNRKEVRADDDWALLGATTELSVGD